MPTMTRFSSITSGTKLLLAACLLAMTTLPAMAQYRNTGIRNGVVSSSVAGRYGLKRAWLTQVQLDSSQSRIAHITQHVSTTKFYTVFAVVDDISKTYFSERAVDRFGQPIGIEGAKQLAKDLIDDIEEKGAEAHLETKQIPEIMLYVQTDRGTLHAIDGHTGRTLWVSSVGKRSYPTLQPGANDDYVALINGSSLYVLDRSNGKEVFSRRLKGAPGAGASLTEERVFVPQVNGSMEVYSLKDHRQPPWRHSSTGRLFVQPTISTNSVCWATDRGYLYVGHRDKRGVRFRLEARDAIVAPATFLPPNRLFAASIDGYVYCVHEFNGDIVWRYSVGDPISSTPVVTNKAIFAVADDAGMYRINTEGGFQEWWTPRIKKFLAVSKNRVYCVGNSGQLQILDAETGGRVDSLPLGDIDLTHLNWQTDRLFIGTEDGVLQCLHEIDSDWPVIHNLPDPETSARKDVVQQKNVDDEPKPDEGGDPFGGADDPFGGGDDGDDPFGGGDDPFGGGGAGGDDPFGGGGDAGGDDPFGGGGDAGGDDPFGGGGGGDDPFGGGGGGGGDDPFGGGGDDNPFGL